MKIHLEPTSRIVEVTITGAGGKSVPGRVWQGHTDDGTEISVVITRLVTHQASDQRQFNESLTPVAPTQMSTEAFPHRMVL